jgi:2-keto-3-deoxy-galactonokinase
MNTIAYYDVGTSNSRLLGIVNGEVIYEEKVHYGSRNVSIEGHNACLLLALFEMYEVMLHKMGVEDHDVDKIFASGMVTSPFGLVEVPHLHVPAGVKELAANIYIHVETKYFKRSLYLVRGLKTMSSHKCLDSYSIADVNNMRGEEIEIIGLLSVLPDELKENALIIMPGSHTHIVAVRDARIIDILSTFSGELLFALKECTILADSLKADFYPYDTQMLIWGYRCLQEEGLSRALYMGHAMKVFSVNEKQQRYSFIMGIVAGLVVQALLYKRQSKWGAMDNIVVAGALNLTKPFEIILEQVTSLNIRSVDSKQYDDSFACLGLKSIMKELTW